MKKSRQIIVSVAIIASLLTAPIAVAQPHTPFLGGFDLISFVSNLVDEITSIFAPATTSYDPNGVTNDGEGTDTTGLKTSDEEDQTTQGAHTSFDPNG